MQKNLKITTTLLGLGAAAALALTACGQDTNQAPSVAPTSTSASQAPAGQSASTDATTGVAMTESWVKAAQAKGGEHAGMTGLFGVVTNHTSADRTIVKATSDAAGMVQLHTTITTPSGGTEMKEKDGGFPLPAGGTVTLEPGGDHVMLMGLKKDLEAGDTVDVVLTLDDGTEVKVAAPVKPFSGAKETYAPSGEASTPEASDSMGSMDADHDMSSMSH